MTIGRAALSSAAAVAAILVARLRAERADQPPPSWEPGTCAWLAAWVPAPPASLAGRLAAYAWASPITAAGILVGLAAGARPRVRDGVLLFADARGPASAMLRWRGFGATTLGHVVVAVGQPSAGLMAHELVHTRQAERLGPLFAPAYVGLLAAYGYRQHPMERAARAGAASRRHPGATSRRRAPRRTMRGRSGTTEPDGSAGREAPRQ